MASQPPPNDRGAKKTKLNNWYDNFASGGEPQRKGKPDLNHQSAISRGAGTNSGRVHTPHTYPRTKANSQTANMRSVKQSLDYETSSTENDDPSDNISNLSKISQSSADSRLQRRETPESNQIVGRLMQIRDYIKQATAMKESLAKDLTTRDRDQVTRLEELVEHLREQEEGYLELLQKMLTDNSNTSNEASTSKRNTSMPAVRYENRVVSPPQHTVPQKVNGNTAAADDDSDALADADNTSIMSECTTDKEAEVSALKQQRDLLKKMLEQQRLLKNLHERQAELLELKRRAENEIKSKEVNSHQTTLNNITLAVASTSKQSNAAAAVSSSSYRFGDEDKDTDERETAERRRVTQEEEEQEEDEDEDEDKESSSSSSSSETVEEDIDELPIPADSSKVPPELKALREKLSRLQNFYNENLNHQKDDKRKLQTLRQMQQGFGESSQTFNATNSSLSADSGDPVDPNDSTRKQLQNKLHKLQAKKETMEQLLSELNELREIKRGNDNTSLASESTSTGHVLREMRDHTDHASQTIGQAETVLDVMEQESKLRKLEEVRNRLDQLKDLVQYYQQNSEAGSRPPSEQDMSLRGNLFVPETNGSTQKGKPNISTAATYDSSAALSSTDASDVESNISLGEFQNDPEIQEKVKKLHEARERLDRLKSLVNMVQTWPDAAEMLPEDLAQLASGALDDTESNCSTISKVTSASGAHSFSELYEQSRKREQQPEASTRISPKQPVKRAQKSTNKSPSGKPTSEAVNHDLIKSASNKPTDSKAKSPRTVALTSPGEVPLAQRVSERQSFVDVETSSMPESLIDSVTESEAYYLMRMEEQKKELQDLTEERNKLLQVQAELQGLHKKYTSMEGVQSSKAPAHSAKPLKPVSNGRGSRSVKVENNLKAGVKFSCQLPGMVDRDPANDDLYSRMMEQKIRKQENRKYKGDDDQMTADVTTMATWGDSDSSSTSSSTESDDGVDNQNQLEDEEDDGYPSDGIQQVEEEEEAVDQQSDRDTYTVEEDYKLRQRYPTDVVPRAARPKRPHTHQLTEPGYPGAGDYWRPSDKLAANKKSSGNQVAIGAGVDMISKMKKQLDATTDMCQHLLKEQKKLSSSLQGAVDHTEPASAWQQSRIVYSINQLYTQVLDMQAALQVTVDQVYALTQHMDRTNPEGLSHPSASRTYGLPASDSRLGLPGWARPTTGRTPRPESRQAAYPSLWSYDPAYLSNREQAGGPERLDRSELNGDKTPTPDSTVTESTTKANSGEKGKNVTDVASSKELSDHNYNIPPLDLDKLIKRRQEQGNALQSYDRTYPSPSLSAIAAGKVHVPLESMYRPGVSAGISGTAYADSVTSSVASSSRDRKSADTTPLNTPGKQPQARNNNNNSSEKRDSSASDFSLFEALRETIYSEVATLISQNENRPHYLIELFRELQMLSTDYLRQRGLYSIKELVTKFLTEDVASLSQDMDLESNADVLAPQPAWMLYQASASELTPSESVVSTDEEEVRQMLKQPHHITPSGSTVNISQRAGSIQSDLADYIEYVETMSSQSTPASHTGSAWEDPFSRDALGDTVINLEKAMQKVKEIDENKQLRKENSTVSLQSGSSVQDQGTEGTDGDVDDEDDDGNSEGDDDEDDDASTAAMKMTQLDTQMLDKQIKSIMTEIIPVLREHMENVCSSSLLDYIKNKVVELTIQTRNPSPDVSQEFTSFFEVQLGNILKDSLAKYEGRRMRDAGEEVLVDISEILFNELAFFKLMQNLDDPNVKDKITVSKWPVQAAASSTEPADSKTVLSIGRTDLASQKYEVQDNLGNNYQVLSQGEMGGDSDVVTSDNQQEDEISSSEEEDRGKARDDAFAEETNTKKFPEFKDVHYELAPSETKPMTRIGSDEDCSDDDDESTPYSTDDEDDTAISRQAANEQDMELVDAEKPEEVPVKLNVDMEAIAQRASEEQNSLSLIVSQFVDVGAELAGNGNNLTEPLSDNSEPNNSKALEPKQFTGDTEV